MRFLFFILLTMLSANLSWAQVTDFVTDDFNNIANWQQNTSSFSNNTDGYISDTSTTYGTDLVYRPLDNLYMEAGDVEWDIDISTNFTVSSTNCFQIILSANHESTDYDDFEGFGIATGLKPVYNALCLVAFKGPTATVVYCDSTKFTSKTVKVTRSKSGEWTVNGKTVYQDANKFYNSNYLITKFKFNKTGAQKFGFKFTKISQTQGAVELKSTLDSATVLDENTVRIYFNGRLGAQDRQSYLINGEAADNVSVMGGYIDVSKQMDLTENQNIVVSGVTDIYGNSVDRFTYNYQGVKPHQIVINEIMANVSTDPNLQCHKYIELYNNTESDIRMKGFRLVVGKDNLDFPESTVKSNGYMLLSADTIDNSLIMPVVSKLTISGKYIAVLDSRGNVVDSLSYSTDMYNDNQRSNGGYSIERVDPKSDTYWKASQAVNGGTPGYKNSVYTDMSAFKVPEYQDIVINEIMYFPNEGMPQFIELYNNSESSILLDNMAMVYRDSDNIEVKAVTFGSCNILPSNGFLVLTSDTSALQSEYECGGMFLQLSKFPNLDTAKGYIVIRAKSGAILDSVYFNDMYHSRMTAYPRGISLERKDSKGSSFESGNWMSGSVCSPGLPNNTEIHDNSEESFSIENQLIRPGNSDYYYTITFNYSDPETVVNVQVFNSIGRRVSTPAISQPVSYGDKVVWDGLNYSGYVCQAGIYVVLITVCLPNTKIKTYKRVCVVGRQ